MSNKIRVLIVGESAFKIHTHFKGFASYETGYCSLDLQPFIEKFTDTEIEISFMANHEISLRFPFTVEEMNKYSVIVISDAPADSFLLHPDSLAGDIMPNRLKVIQQYVEQGGGFAMIGGWMSFGGFHGKAHYSHSPLVHLLPVEIESGDDRMEIPEGCYPEVTSNNHPILRGLPEKWPDLLGYNRVTVNGGTTLLAIKETGDPLLVVDDVGQGRVGCFTSDILPHWGSPRFKEWIYYVPFWSRFFAWLSGNEIYLCDIEVSKHN